MAQLGKERRMRGFDAPFLLTTFQILGKDIDALGGGIPSRARTSSFMNERKSKVERITSYYTAFVYPRWEETEISLRRLRVGVPPAWESSFPSFNSITVIA